MKPPTSFAESLDRTSNGRLAFDAGRRQLRCLRADGQPEWQVSITEVELRRLLQRLLLTAPAPLPPGEAMELAVTLLLDRVEEILDPVEAPD